MVRRRRQAGASSIETLERSPERAAAVLPLVRPLRRLRRAAHVGRPLSRLEARPRRRSAQSARASRREVGAARRRAWGGPAARDLSRPLSAWRARRGRLHARPLARHRRDRRLPAVLRRRWRARSMRPGRSRGDLRGLGKPLDIGVTATLDGLDVDLRGSGPLELAESAQAHAHRGRARPRARLQSRRGRHRAPAAARRLRRGARHAAARAASCRRPKRARRRSRNSPRARSPKSKTVADLFCGAGAFALSLARRREVFAVDADAAAIAALARARRDGAWPAQLDGRDARSLPPAAQRRRARRLRRRPVRPAARGRRGAGARIRRKPRCRSSSRSPATRRPSPATRASSSTAAFGSRRSRRLTSSAFRPMSKSPPSFAVRAQESARAEAPRVNATKRDAALDALERIVGARHVLTDPALFAGALVEPRGLYQGQGARPRAAGLDGGGRRRRRLLQRGAHRHRAAGRQHRARRRPDAGRERRSDHPLDPAAEARSARSTRTPT